MPPYNLVKMYRRFGGTHLLYSQSKKLRPEDGGSSFLRNVDTYVRDYTASHSEDSTFKKFSVCISCLAAAKYPRGCRFSSTVTRRLQNHIRFRPREKQVVLNVVEVYIRFRPPPLFMFASPSTVPIPVAARSKAWVCGRSPAGMAASNPSMGMNVSVKRSPTECGVSECDREASTLRRPWPRRGCCTIKKNEVR
jgi:hypothetical protein